MPRQEGSLLAEDFFNLTGGLNTADSPFAVMPSEAAGGKNFDYAKRGGVQKRSAHGKLNAAALTEARTLGLGLWDKPSATRLVMRAAGRKIQNFSTTLYSTTNLTEDTTGAGSDFWANASTKPVTFRMFNTADAGVLWGIGGGATSLYGAYSGTKVTQNGVPALTTSSFTATPTGAGATITLADGTYRYTLVFRKSSTQALGNASTTVEASATVTAATHDYVQLDWTVSNNDTTKYDKIYIYRSSVGGSAGFTAGSLVTIVNSNVTTYNDTGANTTSSVTVPRAGSVSLDNSEPVAGEYSGLTLFKRRLVIAKNSTVYFSDINKSESWPTYQTITIPSGGEITALGVISRTAAGADSISELLCVFKQNELWVITGDGTLDGNGLPDWSLKFIDNSGCANQPLLVSAEGHLAWVSHRGIHLWNGEGRPLYISRKIEDKFALDGDIDKSKLNVGVGVFSQGRNEIQWYLSSKSLGEQKYCLKLDLRLTQLGGEGTATGARSADAVFTPDHPPFRCYAALPFFTSTTASEEYIYLGGGSGHIYRGFSGTSDAGGTVNWEYTTPFLTLGVPGRDKRITKIVAYVLDTGSYDLNLTYWSQYRFSTSDEANLTQTISPAAAPARSVWGEFTWGSGIWGANGDKIRPVVFNLNSFKNNNEGEAFRFQFSQSGSDKKVMFYGFTVYYTELPLRK